MAKSSAGSIVGSVVAIAVVAYAAYWLFKNKDWLQTQVGLIANPAIVVSNGPGVPSSSVPILQGQTIANNFTKWLQGFNNATAPGNPNIGLGASIPDTNGALGSLLTEFSPDMSNIRLGSPTAA